MLPFSDLTSDNTLPADLPATVTFSTSGNQLIIDIQNDADFQIAQLYFNADPTLTDLTFDPASSPLDTWSIAGRVTDPQDVKSPFGSFDWLIDFGSGPKNRLPSGPTRLVLDMTGTTTEGAIATTFSTHPPGNTSVLAVLKFEAGPGDDSAFAGTLVPEPATCALMLGGLVLVCGSRRHRRR
jgi:hypothetical protein